MVLLGVLSKKHIPDLGFKEMVAPFLKLAMAGAAMAGVMIAVSSGLRMAHFAAYLPWPAKFAEYPALLLAALAGCLAYALVTLALRLPEAQYIQER
ncbi:hypothetical protein ACW4FQ_31965, partial [Escherichia coli]